jgi:glycosyltransferase involved in cell wall biosynthesis
LKRLLFLVTEDWYFCSHRLPIARAAKAAGYEVGVACRVQDHAARIEEAGIALHPLKDLSRSSRHPLRETAALREITALYRALRPDLVHHVALKPVIYGSIAARRAGVPAVVNAMAGLGYVFSSRDVKARLARPVVGAALRALIERPRSRLIVQNQDDADHLGVANTVVIAGSGVDLDAFAAAPQPPGVPLVVLPARMLRDKGVVEFVEAARRLKGEGVVARFALVGAPDEENPAAIPQAQLRAWVSEGAVEWWGWREDMAAVFRESALVCLPSWREGLPKALIEAAATGRAIVSCDVAGCREVVREGETGFLVPPRDPLALGAALRKLIDAPALRAEMGRKGREHAARFSTSMVVERTLDLYRELA